MYKSVVSIIVTVLVTVGYGQATVIDIADFDTIKRLELEDEKPIKDVGIDRYISQDHTGVDNPPEYDIPAIKRVIKIDVPIKNGKDRTEPEYLQPDWSAQGSLESDDELERAPRSVYNGQHGHYSEYDSSESYDCDHDHGHGHHGHISDSDTSDYSGPDEFWDQHYDREAIHGNPWHTHRTRPSISTSTSRSPRPRPSTSPSISTAPANNGVESSTTPSFYGTTSRPPGRINIDVRLGDTESKEVRTKRMVWNVAQPSNEFEDSVKPVKMRWSWDDQKPEIVPPVHDIMDDEYNFKKSNSFRPHVPVVNFLKPCETKFERRDRHGRCRVVFA